MTASDNKSRAIRPIRPIRAIVHDAGEMGSIVTRLLVECGAKIVGAIARSETKVGRDPGEVAGLEQLLGVTVENNPAAPWR